MIPEDKTGWKVPEKCDKIMAFRVKGSRFSIEYYRDHSLVDLHIHKKYLSEFNETPPTVLEETSTCGACAERSFHGCELSGGKVYPIHKSCYRHYLEAMKDLKNAYPDGLIIEFL